MLRTTEGIIAKEEGELADAADLLNEAVSIADAAGFDATDALLNLADVDLRAGRPHEAREAIERVVSAARHRGDTRNLVVALTLLGTADRDLRRLDQARVDWTEAVQVAQTVGFEKEAHQAAVNLATIDAATQPQELLSVARAAQEWHRKNGLELDGARIAVAAGIALAKLKHHDEARRLFRDAYKVLADRAIPLEANAVLLNLTIAELNLGELDTAQGHAELCARETERLGLLALQPEAYHWLARVQLARLVASNGDLALAQESLTMSEDSYEKAIDALGMARASRDRPDDREVVVGATEEELFEEAIATYLKVFAQLPAWADAEIPFRMSERGRARSFLDAIQAEARHRLPDDHPLVQERQQISRALFELGGRDPEAARSLLERLSSIRTRIARETPVVRAMSDSQLASVGSIRACLGSDAALVEYFVGARAETVSVFLVRSDAGISGREIDVSGIGLQETVESLRDEIGANCLDPAAFTAGYPRGRRLRRCRRDTTERQAPVRHAANERLRGAR